jgi:hypothetical protein
MELQPQEEGLKFMLFAIASDLGDELSSRSGEIHTWPESKKLKEGGLRREQLQDQLLLHTDEVSQQICNHMCELQNGFHLLHFPRIPLVVDSN